MADIRIHNVNEIYVRVETSQSVAYELRDYFTFKVPGYQFSPAFKNRRWDGNIRLFDVRTCRIYRGLTRHIISFANDRNYTVEYDEFAEDFSVNQAADFIKSINLKLVPHDYQLAAFVHAIRNKRALLLSPTACQKKGDLVFTSEGWKKIEDIQIGDKVFGADGKEKEIIRTFSGKSKLYDIVPKNSRHKITVTKEHVLAIKHTDSCNKYGYNKGDKDRITYITVDEYIKKSKYYKHCSVLFYNNIPLEYGNDPITILDPYFIGCYIGDGRVHSCAITTKDKEIEDAVVSQAKDIGASVKVRGITHHIIKAVNKRNVILSEFEKFGLIFGGMKNHTKCDEKHIPHKFLKSSKNFRYQLLAGLLDSDGHLSNNTNFEFSSKSIQLANDVQQLAVSLGLVSYVKEKHNRKYNRTYYRTIIMGDIHLIPTKIPRKKAQKVKKLRDSYVSSFSVVESDEDEYFGFEVQDNLYITNGGMITHNSGKSLMIYLILRYLHDQLNHQKTLIIVPTTSLVSQLATDFSEYGFDTDTHVHKIYSGLAKTSDKPITISTWQSLYTMPRKYFEQFDGVIGDECHLFKAKSLVGIMTNLANTRYRIGTTGTLDDSKTHRLVLEGLFGPVRKVTTTKELMDQKHVADFSIKCLLLKHTPKACLEARNYTYPQEIEYLVLNEERNTFISNLALSLNGNTLILYQYVEKHGKLLHELINKKIPEDRKVFFVSGDTHTDAREETRRLVESETNAIIVASFGVFSTGVNIKNIHSIIFASPAKSRIRNLQSIGRGLRKSATKTSAVLYDIADDLRHKEKNNYTLNHFMERIKIYSEEKFKFKVYKIQMKE